MFSLDGWRNISTFKKKLNMKPLNEHFIYFFYFYTEFLVDLFSQKYSTVESGAERQSRLNMGECEMLAYFLWI